MANDVELNDRRVRVLASAGQTVFDIDFPILTSGDVSVYLNGQLITAYTVNLQDRYVTFSVGTDDGDIVTIEGNTQPIRESSYPRSGALLSSLLNDDIRRLLYLAQEIKTAIGRSISLAQDEIAGVFQRLPKKEKGKMLKWGDDGLINSDSNIDDLDDAVGAAVAAQMEAESAAAAADASAVAANLSKQAAEAAAAGMKWRGSVKVATTANIALTGLQTINGVAVTAGHLVLAWKQDNQAQNGVYVVAAGAWSRVIYADTWSELVGMVVTTEEGTVDADMPFICIVNTGGTIGVTAVTFTYLPSPVLDGAIYRVAQIVAGVLNFAHFAAATFATTAEALLGTANKVMTAAVFQAVGLIQRSASVALTGATIDLTGIPAGAKRVTIMMVGASLTGNTDSMVIRLGTGGVFDASGYAGSYATINSSAAANTAANSDGIFMVAQSAASLFVTKLTLDLFDEATNTWIISGDIASNTSNRWGKYVASKSLSGPLDGIRFLTTSGTYDAGNAKVTWEF